MANKTKAPDLHQQGVIQLRPSDQILVMQNGQEKRMLVQSLIDYIRNVEMNDPSQSVMNAAIAAAIATCQPLVAPDAAIASLPATVASLSVLGISVVAATDGQSDRTAINAILVALRHHGIIAP